MADRTSDLRDANARLVKADRVKSEFLATVSHELRTPLNAIVGFADLRVDPPFKDAFSEAERQRHLGTIAESGRLLLRLVNDILDMACIEAGQFKLQPAMLALDGVLQEVGEMISTTAQAKSIRLETDRFAGEVWADARALHQMLLNLLSNAIKFTPEGGWIRGSTEVDDNWIYLKVEDNGVGIDAADQERIFRPFERLRPEAEGTGLGLAICSRLATAHGGRLEVQSDLGQGSTFTIVLPRVQDLALAN